MELFENLEVKRGTTVLIGRPAKPFEKKVSDELLRIALQLEVAMEVHIPQCFAVGVMEQPEQICVIVVKDENIKETALAEITRYIRESKIIQEILVWILPMNSDFLSDIRAAKCQLNKKKRSIWGFWK